MDDTARYILAIAEKGSISQAAESVHLSQSALSQRLANEETRLGAKLFNRSRVPLQITDAGRVYLEWARASLRAEEEMRENLQAVSVGRRRTLRVGVSAPRFADVLCDAATRFCRENPTCLLSFQEVGRRELINAAFVNDLIDFAVLTPQQPEPSLFMSKPICEERYVYVAPAAWELPALPPKSESGLPVVTLPTISSRPFIMPTFANRFITIIESLFSLAPAKPQIVANCVSPAMQISLVRRGLGASIITTASGMVADSENLAFYDVEGITGKSFLYYSYRIGREPSPDEAAFMAILRELLAERHLLIG